MDFIVEDWASYFCRVNDELASVRLNLGLHSPASVVSSAGLPHLLWVFLYFNDPRPDGLSSNEESPMLFKIEDALMGQLEKHCGATHAGCITTLGRREFYCYGRSVEDFSAALQSVAAEFKDYKFTSGNQLDPGWYQYFFVLFPAARERQTIENQKLLDVLQQKRADAKLLHVLDHWLYFGSEKSREALSELCLRAIP